MKVIIKTDRSPVADLKRPFDNRLRREPAVSGAIELAYLRGLHEGLGLHWPLTENEIAALCGGKKAAARLQKSRIKRS